MRASEEKKKIGQKEEINYTDIYDNPWCLFYKYMILIYTVFPRRFLL